MKNILVFLLFLSLSLTLFAETNQKESEERILLEHIQAVAQLLLYTPEAMLFNDGDKCYVDERIVIQNEGKDSIPLQNGNFLTLPARLVDANGSFLLASLVSSKKLFKCKCNNCPHEWYGGVFTMYCPNCGSSDFRVVYDGS